MAINFDDALEARNGFIVTDTDDNGLAYLTSGSGDPTGSAAPVNSWYYRQDNYTMWYKFGVGNNDWRQVRAADITFDNATNGFTATQVQAAIEEAKETAIARVESLAVTTQTNTTSNGWVTATGWPLATATLDIATYIIDYTCNFTNSDKEKGVGTRVQWRSGTSGSWTEVVGSDIRNGVSEDNQFDLRTGFAEITTTVSDVVQVRWQVGQTDNGGTGRIKNMAVKITRKVT